MKVNIANALSIAMSPCYNGTTRINWGAGYFSQVVHRTVYSTTLVMTLVHKVPLVGGHCLMGIWLWNHAIIQGLVVFTSPRVKWDLNLQVFQSMPGYASVSSLLQVSFTIWRVLRRLKPSFIGIPLVMMI